MKGKANRNAAKIEAWEEAGVKKGKVKRKSVGTYKSKKELSNGQKVPCSVQVYVIKVSKMVKKYPEYRQRDRKWVPLRKAAKAVDDPALGKFLKKYAKAA